MQTLRFRVALKQKVLYVKGFRINPTEEGI